MGKDIKNLMDDIIKDTEKRYNDDDETCYEKFDKEKYREKLSMFVLKDIISAMMANQTEDLDGMIDESILKHIHDDYNGTCFGYLCNARDKCKSPLLAEIIQEIENKTAETAQECAITKNHCVAEAADVKKMLEGVEDYDQFIQKIASEVSSRVVDDVAGLLTDGGGKAPTFKDLDDKIELTPTDTNATDSTPGADDTTATDMNTDNTTDMGATDTNGVDDTNVSDDNTSDVDNVTADMTGATDNNASTPTDDTQTPGATPEVKTEEDTSLASEVNAPVDTGSSYEAPTDTTPMDTTTFTDTSSSSPSSFDTNADVGDNTTGAEIPVEESVILTMCGNIVLEQALMGNRISTEEGIERAIVQFCLSEMDHLFKQPSTIYKKYLVK